MIAPRRLGMATSALSHAVLGAAFWQVPWIPDHGLVRARASHAPVALELLRPTRAVVAPSRVARPRTSTRAPEAPAPEVSTSAAAPPPTQDVVAFDQTAEPLGDSPGTERLSDPALGLSAASVAPSATAAAAIGNTLATDATGASDGLGFVSVPFAGLAHPPKLIAKAPLRLPPEAQRGLEGTVRLALTIAATGAVASVELVEGLRADVDFACRQNALASRWSPGSHTTGAVTVTGVPFACRVQNTVDLDSP